MGTPESTITKLLEHLRGRKIASILEESNEKNDGVALKLMTIIDHKLEQRGVYTKIKEASNQISSPNYDLPISRNLPRKSSEKSVTLDAPAEFKPMFHESDESSESDALMAALYVPFVSKLLKQLLSIKSFGRFHFFKYIPPIKKFNYILQCRQCSLIGPYFIVLSHMVLSHGAHIGSKQCQWCKASDLSEHIQKNKLEECYKKYLEKESIDDPSYPSVIITFYEMIEDLAKELGVLTTRRANFTGVGKPKKEKWFFDGADQDVVVYHHRRPTPIKNLDKLNNFFKTAIGAYYGNSRILEFMPQDNDAAIEVNGQENDAASSTSTRRRTRKRQQTQRHNTDESQNNNGSSSSDQPENVPGTSSKRPTMSFGQTMEEFIENIPSDEIKINAKLKVQSVVLKFSKKAYEQRINREHE